MKRHKRDLPGETPVKDKGGTPSRDKGDEARGARGAFRGQCMSAPREGGREGRRAGEKESETVVQFQESQPWGGWEPLNQIHVAEESCTSRNGPALVALLCSVIAWSSPGKHGKHCGGSRRAAAGAVFPCAHQSSNSEQHIFMAASGGLISAAEERLE